MIWENYEKKNYFTSYQTIWGNPVSMIWENYGKKNFYPVSYENSRQGSDFFFSGSAKLLIIIPIVCHCL